MDQKRVAETLVFVKRISALRAALAMIAKDTPTNTNSIAIRIAQEAMERDATMKERDEAKARAESLHINHSEALGREGA